MPKLLPPKAPTANPTWGVRVEQERATGDINIFIATEDGQQEDLFAYIDSRGRLHLLPFREPDEARAAGLDVDDSNLIRIA